MDKKSYIQLIRNILKGIRDNHVIKRTLEKNGFHRIGRGCYKSVYTHADYPNWVVKVFNGNNWWYWDHSSVGILPQELKPFWLKNIYICRRYAIQPLVDGAGGTDKDAYDFFVKTFNGKHYEYYDIHLPNTRYHNGKPVLLDYTDKIGKGHPKERRPTL